MFLSPDPLRARSISAILMLLQSTIIVVTVDGAIQVSKSKVNA